MKLYPLKFEDNFKEKIWGGSALGDILGRKVAKGQKIGESWEISEHNSGPSIIANGEQRGKALSEIVKQNPSAVLGKRLSGLYGKLPLLFKFIDANDKLSIQVHPDDTYAEIHENSLGKTEAWYVVHAEANAKIICGLKRPLTRSEVEKGIVDGQIENMLREYSVKTGDCFFVPAGTVHAIEAGLVIYEVQEVSDVTYRLYDRGRVGDDGRPRDLHLEQSLSVMNFNDTEDHKTVPVSITYEWGRRDIIAACDYFVLSRYSINRKHSFHTNDNFKVITLLSGEMNIEYNDGMVHQFRGESVLIPAALDKFTLHSANGSAEALITEVPIDKKNTIDEFTKSGISKTQLTKLGGLS
jgi:mannose-6-phosphate isomerase